MERQLHWADALYKLLDGYVVKETQEKLEETTYYKRNIEKDQMEQSNDNKNWRISGFRFAFNKHFKYWIQE